MAVILSNRSVILLINGLFHTDYPVESTITYNWTEHHDEDLKRTIADAILTISHAKRTAHAYHIEAQMYEDEEIEFWVFDYGYKYALDSRNGHDTLYFPEPQIIQLYHQEKMPEEKTIMLDFGSQGKFKYKVPVFKLLEHNISELDQRKMVILIPFMVLKLRRDIEKERTLENMEALRSLILDDILNVITKNQIAGNITASDANVLRNLIHRLYNHLYAHYREFAEGGLNDMMDDGLVLEADILEAELTKKVTQQVTEQVTEQVTQQVTEQVTKRVTERVSASVRRDMARTAFLKLKSVGQVADLLDIPIDEVEAAVGEQ